MNSNLNNGFDLVRPRRLYAGDGDGAGADGGEGGTATLAPEQGGDAGSGAGAGTDKESIEAQIQSAVDAATASIRRNRDEILQEKRKAAQEVVELRAELESLGGAEGLKRLHQMRESLEKDELGKLLADGKHDEWFDKRTAALRGDFEQKITARDQQVTEVTEERDKVLQELANLRLRIEVDRAALPTEVKKTALSSGDVHLAAAQVFTYDPQLEKHVIKDSDGVVLLGKDGQSPKTVQEWLEEQKGPRRHWFPPSQGAGAAGSHGGGNVPVKPDADAIGRMSLDEFKKYREAAGLTGNRGGIPG